MSLSRLTVTGNVSLLQRASRDARAPLDSRSAVPTGLPAGIDTCSRRAAAQTRRRRRSEFGDLDEFRLRFAGYRRAGRPPPDCQRRIRSCPALAYNGVPLITAGAGPVGTLLKSYHVLDVRWLDGDGADVAADERLDLPHCVFTSTAAPEKQLLRAHQMHARPTNEITPYTQP